MVFYNGKSATVSLNFDNYFNYFREQNQQTTLDTLSTIGARDNKS